MCQLELTLLSNEHSPSAVEHVEENVVYMKINLCFRKFRNLGNKHSVVLSNRHSRCLDCNFEQKLILEETWFAFVVPL